MIGETNVFVGSGETTKPVDTEILNLSVSSDGGNVDGFEITVRDLSNDGAVIGITTKENSVFKIPFGTTYSIEASAIDGFIKPPTETFTASVQERNVSLVYKMLRTGVWIQGVSGELYSSDKWDSQETPNGIALITNDCSFVMALENCYYSTCRWGGYNKQIERIATTTEVDEAIADFEGLRNTDEIITQLEGTNDGYVDGSPAAKYCKGYAFPNGQNGYLGAAGEWGIVLDNIVEVNAAISKCGGVALSSYYWVSTQYSEKNSWAAVRSSASISNYIKTRGNYVRAFTTI